MKKINTNELQKTALPAGQSAASCSVDRFRVLDLFSGIGGFSLGLERAGMLTVAFCEIEKFPRKVLQKHWPDVPIFEDVRKLHAEDLPEAVDVICGGYPCQPFSQIGKRKGEEDERHLWPEFMRLVRECKPSWVVCENVAGHIKMGLDTVLSDLESEGYTCWTLVIPACAVNAPHRRDRVWIIANNDSNRRHIVSCVSEISNQKIFYKTTKKRFWFINHGNNNIEFREEDAPQFCRIDDGLPRKLDKNRLKALGNTVVPQIPEMIGRAILAQTA